MLTKLFCCCGCWLFCPGSPAAFARDIAEMREACQVARVPTCHNSVVKMHVNQLFTVKFNHATFAADLRECVAQSVVQGLPYKNDAQDVKVYLGRSRNLTTGAKEMNQYMLKVQCV